jgi:RimJ/RimL family protein N-acetyltransferase
MRHRPAGLHPLIRAVQEVETAHLIEFAERNERWLGVRFCPPRTPAAWTSTLADGTQRWYAIVPGSSAIDPPVSASQPRRPAPAVIGLVVFSRWAPSPWRSAEIGFAVDADFAGKGLIQTAVPGLLDELLGDELSRIEARVDPDNNQSAKSLARLGFSLEGHARHCVDGRDGRRTQAQWAITSVDRQGSVGLASPPVPLGLGRNDHEREVR